MKPRYNNTNYFYRLGRAVELILGYEAGWYTLDDLCARMYLSLHFTPGDITTYQVMSMIEICGGVWELKLDLLCKTVSEGLQISYLDVRKWYDLVKSTQIDNILFYDKKLTEVKSC